MPTSVPSECRRLLLVSLTLVACTGQFASAQFSAFRVSLESHLDLTDLGAGNGSDCWGYVSPSGREYALMGVNNKLVVVEVTDPANAVIIDSVSHSSSIWADVKVFEHYAYVVNETGGGIDIIDLADVDLGSVSLVQRFTDGGTISTSHNVVINTDSGYLYLVGSNLNGGGPVAYDLNADPQNPTFAGQWIEEAGARHPTSYHHDAQVVTYTTGPYAGKEILFGASGSRGLDVLDVTDKANMTLLSRTPYPNVSYCHQVWTEDLRYLYIDDELDEQGGNTPTTRTLVFDLADLSSPQLVNTFTTGLPTIDHNLYVRDCVIYEANYQSGLRIFDASDPVSPVAVGYFDTYPGSDAVAFDGAWSVFPFFPSGTVIVSDIDRGLFVLDVSAALAAAGGCPGSCDVQSVRSCRDHGTAGRLCLDMGIDGGIEPRSGGIAELEIDLLDPSAFGGLVTVACQNAGDLSGSVSGSSVIGNTLTLTFAPPLPDGDACTVDLGCEASVCVRGLAGDVDRNGTVATTDASIIKPRFGLTPDAASAEYDYDASGIIATTDFSLIKPLFGHTAPACP